MSDGMTDVCVCVLSDDMTGVFIMSAAATNVCVVCGALPGVAEWTL